MSLARRGIGKMAGIHVLEKSVYELIAAGEVIERPASIVKELVENSIDAHADYIQIEIQNGGKKLIRVTDNGDGLLQEDCPKAFLRHATSKVSSQSDLDQISTLGFRGEALASICAVSKVELLTRCAGNEMGTCYRIEGGEETFFDSVGCALGTSICVENVFYNVPARMKFLKKDSIETGAIHDIIDKLALSHANIAFTFKKDGKIMLQTPGNNNLTDTIYAIFGRAFSDTLMSIQYKSNGMEVSGFISQPMQCRPNRSMQYFFINGRYVLSKTCSVGLEEGYKGSVMTGKFPACIVYLTIPFEQLDINVHPAKIEVRFSDERAVLETLYTAVKQVIAKHNELPKANQVKPHVQRNYFSDDQFKDSVQTNISQKRQQFSSKIKSGSLSSPITEYSVGNDNLLSNHPLLSKSNIKLQKSNTLSAFENHISQEQSDESNSDIQATPESEIASSNNEITEPSASEQTSNNTEPIRIIGELFKTYILAESGDYFIIVDKHAAHERLLYENLKTEKDHMERQTLIRPAIITLSRKEYELALDNSEILYQFGFGAEDFGNCTILLREIPVILEKVDFKQAFMELVKNLSEGKRDLTPQAINQIYHTIACRSAVKGNEDNSLQELQVLFDQVYYNENIRTCPHGRPVVLTIHKERFEKQFGRIQK